MDCGKGGGIVGRCSEFEIVNCYNIGDVEGSSYTGGLIGDARGKNVITNCYNSGIINYKAAIIGNVANDSNNDITITNCQYKKGTATVTIAYNEGDASLVQGEATETENMPDVLSVINGEGAFEADLDGSNGGYPILKVK